jgi:hypothetical protein
MKIKLVAVLFISVFIFAGCQSTGSSNKNESATSPSGTPVVTSIEKAVSTKNTFQPIKPGTVPQLSGIQKSQINDKLNTVISDINSSLNSLDDVMDINLNSVN